MIRKAIIKDIPNIQRIIHQYIQDFIVNSEGKEQFNELALQQLILAPNIYYYVYEKNAKVIGCISYKEPTHLVHFFCR